MNNFRLLVLGAMLSLTIATMAQSYTFEQNYTNWTAQKGTLSISSDHYKQGTHSLCWETAGKSALLIRNFNQFTASSTIACFMQIYLPMATGDTLQVEFLNGSTPKKTARFLCNYKGWREFNRAYNEYASTASVTVTAVRLTLIPTDNGTRQIFFDDVCLNKAADPNRIPGAHWALDAQYMKVNPTPLRLFANTLTDGNMPYSLPTAEEIADIETIRTRLAIDPGYNAPQAVMAKNWVAHNISVVRNPDGSLLKGTIINTSSAALAEDSLVVVGQRLLYLAGGKKNGTNAALAQAFDDYLDLLLDQGLAEGCNIAFASNSYSAPKNVIPNFVKILPACDSIQAEQVCRLIAWMSFYYMSYYPDDTYLAQNVSDVLYLFTMHMLAAAAYRPDSGVAVHELRQIQRFMNRNAEHVPGARDMLKPDGTGFHHDSHYNNYMYAYQTYMNGIYTLRDTHFEVNRTTYDNFGKAILTIYTQATPSNLDNRFYANSLCGRNPFDAGNKFYFSKSLFQQLINSGNSYPDLQQIYQGAFNYFYGTPTYPDAPVWSAEGCHQYNYSPIAVARHNNWVAIMRAPTSKFWGAEIYSKENRFGRYQSHGSLEVMYKGNNLAASGYPVGNGGGGWDWNVIPGTTTVHYTSWTDLTPKGNVTQRFDQYSGGTNFSGALAAGGNGVFATNLTQTDKWGSNQVYSVPTNLKAHKSVFIFDTIMVALGTDISSSGNYGDDMITATNLFQSIISTSVGSFVVNGTEVKSAYSETLPRTKSNWMITPAGTGYYLPTNNEQIQVVYGQQTSPKETGADITAPATTVTAAKAYINHGVKCNDKHYEFAVVPATNPTQMAATAAAMDAGLVYRVRRQDSKVHAVSCGQTTAYAFYGDVNDLDFGIVAGTTHQHLLIDVTDSITGHHLLSVCNPNLEPQSDPTYSWVSSPTQTTMTLLGEWKILKAVEGVEFAVPSAGYTGINITFTEGEAIHFEAVPYDEDIDSALPDTPSASVPVRKILRNGQIYIQRGNLTYTILGSVL